MPFKKTGPTHKAPRQAEVQVVAYVPSQLAVELRRLAAAEYCSLSTLARRLLARGLAQEQRQDGRGT